MGPALKPENGARAQHVREAFSKSPEKKDMADRVRQDVPCGHVTEGYTPEGRLKWRRLDGPGEQVFIQYDEKQQTSSEDVCVCGIGQAEYSCHTEFEYDGEGRLSKRQTGNSLGEERCTRYDAQGKVTVETVILKRAGNVDYSSTTRFEYREDGALRLRLFEDCLGEKRRIEYDRQGRKTNEEIRVVGQGNRGYVARTEYAYTTDEVHFGKTANRGT